MNRLEWARKRANRYLKRWPGIFTTDQSQPIGHDDHTVDRVAVIVAPEYSYPWRVDTDLSDHGDHESPKHDGSGFLEDQAWDQVKEAIDPQDIADHPAIGSVHVADLVVDLTVWDYRVEWTDAGDRLRHHDVVDVDCVDRGDGPIPDGGYGTPYNRLSYSDDYVGVIRPENDEIENWRERLQENRPWGENCEVKE